MKRFIEIFMTLFFNQLGVVTYEGDNYTGAYSAEPIAKYPPGEQNGTPKVIFERFTLVDAAGTAGLDANDLILVGKLPKNSMIVDAYMRLNKSLGATGIFTLGNVASTDEDGETVAADPDGFCPACDGGGQAALSRPNETSLLLGKRFGEETIIQAKCTEVMDDTVLDAVLEVYISYVNK